MQVMLPKHISKASEKSSVVEVIGNIVEVVIFSSNGYYWQLLLTRMTMLRNFYVTLYSYG